MPSIGRQGPAVGSEPAGGVAVGLGPGAWVGGAVGGGVAGAPLQNPFSGAGTQAAAARVSCA